MMVRKISFLFIVLLVFLINGVFAVQQFSGGNLPSSFSGTSGLNSFQYYQPSFDSLYSSPGIDVNSIWPILGQMEKDQCEATSDFIIGIPPGGCSPSVVRSDLLAEQNVPVFCQLYSVKVNPLIEVSSIKTISFKGDYPDGVSAISYHPARAAVRSYRTLLGDPVVNNIGYVVIILKREKVEDNLEEWIAGNLTATIRYDSEQAYGTGRSEHYLSLNEEGVGNFSFAESSFWNGKGKIELLGIGNDGARIALYKGDDKITEFLLKEGETSRSIYFPGFYCSVGLQVRLNNYVAPEDSALLNVDGEEFWVRRGTKILNGQCSVSRINLNSDGVTGSVDINCPSSQRINLRISAKDKNPDGSERPKDENGLIDSTDSNNDFYFEELNLTVRELINDYPNVMKRSNDASYGEETLYKAILLSRDHKKFATQYSLTKIFLDEYLTSPLANEVRRMQQKLLNFDLNNSVNQVYVSNKFKTISLVQLRDEEEGKERVNLRIGGSNYNGLKVGSVTEIEGSNIERVSVSRVYPGRVDLLINYLNQDKRSTSSRVSLNEGGSQNFGGVEVYVEDIDVEEVAHVEIIPNIKRSETEANFTFRIGVEKRAISLSPEKTIEMIGNLNQSIEDWENANARLGKLLEGWKGACFATSSALMLKTMINGLDGESLARSKVMDKYKIICAEENPEVSQSQCYLDRANEIEEAVGQMTDAINEVNKKMGEAQEGNTQSEGLFGEGVTNNSKYKEDLRRQLGSSWRENVRVGSENIGLVAEDLGTVEQIQAALLLEELSRRGYGSGDISYDSAKEDFDRLLRNVALIKQEKENSLAAAESLNIDGLTSEKIVTITGVDTIRSQWRGTYGSNIPNFPSEYNSRKVQVVTSIGGSYLLLLHETGSEGFSGVEKVFKKAGTSWDEVTGSNELPVELKSNSLVFYSSSSGGQCSNRIREGTAELSFYESGQNKGLPAVVPFDLANGWYVRVPNSGGSLGDSSPQGYTAAAEPRYFYICNVGVDGLIETNERDLCQSFDINTIGKVDFFAPCPNLDQREIGNLYSEAVNAIRQASQQYGQKGDYIIDGQKIARGKPAAESNGLECTDFMSPTDCNLMFNVCDPVICPTSRCDLGGRYPVSNVVQSGIIGSVALCLPNFPEVKVPVCLTGIHAGIDSFTQILKSQRECLENNLETGEYVGICDEITSVYKCEFFWGQAAPFLDSVVPTALDSLSGKGFGSVRGGGEYTNTASAWENLQNSVDFFQDSYAQTATRAFQLKNTQEVGGEFCKAFIGTSLPTSAKGIASLLEPESPFQFYAQFDEKVFTDVTLPPTSQYKVYYHIYAGNDVGAQYRIYLKNPPASSYYSTRPEVYVKTGYIARGATVDETETFTLPSGYSELCVEINGIEECGFKKVSTSFAVDYIQDKYVADQVEGEVKTENECVSGKPSAFALANLNLQSGVEEAINPEISLRGIVRVCATANPGAGIVSNNEIACLDNSVCGNGYECKKDEGSERGFCTDSKNGQIEKRNSRWVDVGYCGDSAIRCWMDIDTVKDSLERVEAIDGTTSSILEEQRGLIDDFTKTLEEVRKTLESIEKRIDDLDVSSESTGPGEIELILEELRQIIGDENTHGAGTDVDRANALALKADLYSKIIEVRYRGVIPLPSARSSDAVSEDSSQRDFSDSFSTQQCKVFLGEKIYEIATEVGRRNGVSDSEVKSDTGAKNFGCLALQIAYQESKLTMCKDKDNPDCLYCEGMGKEELLKSSFPGEQSYGVMQINLGQHGGIERDIDEFEKSVNYALQNVLIEGYKRYGDGKIYDSTQVRYDGWDAAIRTYNGWGPGIGNYVEEVKGNREEIAELFPELCGDGGSQNNALIQRSITFKPNPSDSSTYDLSVPCPDSNPLAGNVITGNVVGSQCPEAGTISVRESEFSRDIYSIYIKRSSYNQFLSWYNKINVFANGEVLLGNIDSERRTIEFTNEKALEIFSTYGLEESDFKDSFLEYIGEGEEERILVSFSASNIRGDKDIIVHEDFVSSLRKINNYAEENGVTLFVTSSFRSSKSVSGAVVTPAEKSNHMIGHAIDFNIDYSGGRASFAYLKKSNEKNWDEDVKGFISDIRDDPSLRWGGDFPAEDPIHIDDGYNSDLELWEQKFLVVQKDKVYESVTV